MCTRGCACLAFRLSPQFGRRLLACPPFLVQHALPRVALRFCGGLLGLFPRMPEAVTSAGKRLETPRTQR